MVAPRHPQISENELRQERQIEADEDEERAEPGPPLWIHPAGDLRPPVVKRSEVSHHRAAHHDVVEVGDDEVGVRDVDV